jgi:hypothetical protein
MVIVVAIMLHGGRVDVKMQVSRLDTGKNYVWRRVTRKIGG